MSYVNAVIELRQLLADTDMHKKASKKKLIGAIGTENTVFFTGDKRIFEDTFELFINNVQSDAFTIDDPIKGQITLSEAPAPNSSVTANYYWQFWLDAELINFLNKGAESTGAFNDAIPDQAYLSIQAGLKTASLYFAANMAISSEIQFLINRNRSEEFLIQESGNDDTKFSQTIAAMKDNAKSYWDKAVFHRDDFYKRLGKRNLPAFAIKRGRTSNYGPIR